MIISVCYTKSYICQYICLLICIKGKNFDHDKKYDFAFYVNKAM